MNKRVVLLFVGLLLFSFVSAQAPGGLDPSVLENDSIVRGVGKLQEFAEGERWKYLGEEWQGILLKNKVIARFDSAFTKANVVFVILFARDYALSATLFIAFLIWLFTWLSLSGYFLFIENKGYRNLAALAITIALAHLQIFNFLSEGAFKIIFYKPEWWWSLISFILIVVAIFAYLYINKVFAAAIKKGAEAGKKRALEHRVRKQEEFQRGVGEGV